MSAPRILLTALVAIVAGVFVAGCGSSSSQSSTSTGGSPAASTQLAKFDTCLKSHGVTAPTPNTARRGAGSTAAGPPGGGKLAHGKPGRFTPPKGAGHGHPPGGFGAGVHSQKQAAAYKACAKELPKGTRGFAAGSFAGGGPNAAGSAHFSTATVAKFAACVKEHGYTLPAANTSGKGAIYPKKIESNKKFQAASKPCQSLLRPSGTPPSA